MSKKKKQFQSKEAQAVAHANDEFELIKETIEELNDVIQDLTDQERGASKQRKKELREEKKLYEAKRAELKVQQTLNQAKQNYAVSKFQSKFGNSMSSSDISAGVEKYINSDSGKSEAVSKWSGWLSKGANVAVDAYAKLETIESEKQYETISAQTDILMADIDALGQKSVQAAELIPKAYTSAINASLSNLIDGINEGAYAAASSMIDLGAQSKIFALEQERIDLENKNTKDLRTAQKNATFANLGAQKTQAITNISSEAARLVGHSLNNREVEAFGFGFNTGEAPGAIADASANIAEGAAAANTALTEMEGKLSVQKFENEKKITEARLKYNQEVQKKWIEAGANVEKAWLQFAQKMEGGLLKSEAAANDLGVSMGLSGKQLESFKRAMFESQVAVSKWGKTLEDMQKLQKSYQDETGRNIQFSMNDFDTSFALDKLAGQDGLSAQLASGMELFNHSVSDSNEMIFEMYKNVSKIGLNGRKYMKDLAKNLKLVERYQFKNGVKGMMDMAKWAQNTRFNMDSLDSMLQNFSENGLEGAITKAAGMQVLGGNFAMGADPLAMMWERYSDPQAFAKRQQDMLKGMGTYDSKTGEVKFNMIEQLQLEQFAKYSGQSVEDLMNQQRQRIRGEKVNQYLNNAYNWSDDQKSLVTNKAQLVNGEWKVTMDNGEQKSVSQLSQEDLNHLMPENNEEKLVNYVYDIRDMMTQLTGAKQEATSKLELDGYQQWYQEELARIQTVVSDFDTNYEKYLTEFKEKMGLATEAQKTMLDIMNQGNSNIDSASNEILQEGKNIASTLAQVNTLLQNSLNGLNANSTANTSNIPKPLITSYHKAGSDPINKIPKGGYMSGGMIISKSDTGRMQYTCAQDNVGRNINYTYIDPTLNPSPLPNIKKTNDGISSANGHSMTVAASKVTPINDGEVATTSPQDHAIFAKTGGPFDKLFNGIFSKINAVYKSTNENEQYPKTSIKELYRIAEIAKQNEVQPKPLPSIEMPVRDNGNINTRQEDNTPTVNNGTIKIEPITLNIKLDGVLGQSKDFMEELSKNPMMIRSLSQLISESINKNINGGKSSYTGGVATPRFKGNEF